MSLLLLFSPGILVITPPTVTTIGAVSIEQEVLTIRGQLNVDGNETPSAMGFEFGTTTTAEITFLYDTFSDLYFDVTIIF